MTTLQTAIENQPVNSHPMTPYLAEIVDIKTEAPRISTYWLKFKDEVLNESFASKPGQFNIVTVPGYGEAAFSISTNTQNGDPIGHTIRMAGNVTQAIARLGVGDTVGVRGPFGSHWPIDEHKGKDIYVAAGGIGLPPIRPVIYHIMKNRSDYGEVVVLYGARSPQDLQFTDEYSTWQESDIKIMVTVDRADQDWDGTVGVVPMLFYNLRMDHHNSIVYSCGPEIMLRFVVYEALARRLSPNDIFVSFERNMKCGIGSCGHCQLGPYFVCKDGPVFSYQQLQPYFNVEDF